MQGKLPPKLKELGIFTIPCNIGDVFCGRYLCDLGGNINIMPLSILNHLGIGVARPTTITLKPADRSISYPQGKIEDLLVKVDKFLLPVYFIIMNFNFDEDTLILLGKPFLSMGRTFIDVEKGELTMRVNDQHEMFNVPNVMK